MLLVDGGQSGPDPIWAYENQVRQAGSTTWINLGFWCPATSAPTAVPNAQDIRDQAIRLLPKIAPVSTGATTLVNIQTLLWADTTENRDLGQVTVLGQPVWLHLTFEHAAWNFGDASTATSPTPGKAYDPTTDPCRMITCPDYYGHTYTTTGERTVTVRISWHASYSLDGQHFHPVDTSPITGPPATVHIHVRQARGVLVTTGD